MAGDLSFLGPGTTLTVDISSKDIFNTHNGMQEYTYQMMSKFASLTRELAAQATLGSPRNAHARCPGTDRPGKTKYIQWAVWAAASAHADSDFVKTF